MKQRPKRAGQKPKRKNPSAQRRKQRRFEGHQNRAQKPIKIPNLIEVEVVGLLEDGQPFGRVFDHNLRGMFPRILFDETAPVTEGDIVLATLTQEEGETFRAVVKELSLIHI